MIYFIGGLKHREFKYFEILEQIRKETPNILETVFDASLKEEDRFLEKISMNSIFSVPEIVILKRTEKLKNIERLLEYIESLKKKTGNHKDVSDYVMGMPESQDFYKMLLEMLMYLIPKYEKEGKSHLRIGIGCSGGQHRSVTFVNKLYEDLSKKLTYNVGKYHREVGAKTEI